MTDTTIVKLPTQASFMPMAMTGIGSGALGDKFGDAIAQLVAWRIAVNCNCIPPDNVISSIHTICVGCIIFLSYAIYYGYTRYKNKT